MKRNKLYKTLILSGGLLMTAGLASCEDFLTVYPTGQITEEQFWEDKNDLDNVRAAAYHQMTKAAVTERILLWGEGRSDNFNVTDNSDEHLTRLQQAVLQPTQSMFDWASFYTGINYCNQVLENGERMVANNVDASFREADWIPIKAEMYAVRALYYFYLVRAYCDVPYVTKSIRTDAEAMRDGRQKAEPGAAILGAEIENLEGIRNRATTNFGSTSENKGRFTKQSIKALLADMYLWRGCMLKSYQDKGRKIVNLTDTYSEDSTTVYAADGETVVDATYTDNLSAQCFQKAADLSAEVIHEMDSIYRDDLEDDFMVSPEERDQKYPMIRITSGMQTVYDYVYNQIFGNGNSSESIFELQYLGNANNDVNTTLNTYFYNNSDGSYVSGDFVANPSLFSSAGTVAPASGFGKTDIRLLETTLFTSLTQNTYPIVKNVLSSLTISNMEDMTEGASSTSLRSSGTNSANWPVYRLTDMMLIRAEALARQAESTATNTDALKEGFQLVNAIFERCNPALEATGEGSSTELESDRLNSDYATDKTAADLISLIYNERQLEFFGEGKRWFDLVRMAEFDNSTDDAMTAMGASTSVKNRLRKLESLYNPIYSEEIKVNGIDNGGYLKQNSIWEKYSN